MFPRTAVITASLLSVLTLSAAANSRRHDVSRSPASDEAAIRALDAAWVRAVAAKNADQSASYYAADGILLPPGDATVTGMDALKKGWADLMAMPGFALTFAPTKVSVSGDRAYEIGDSQLTANDKSGTPQTSKGKYVVIWGRQHDGNWKVLVDAPTTTQ